MKNNKNINNNANIFKYKRCVWKQKELTAEEEEEEIQQQQQQQNIQINENTYRKKLYIYIRRENREDTKIHTYRALHKYEIKKTKRELKCTSQSERNKRRM